MKQLLRKFHGVQEKSEGEEEPGGLGLSAMGVSEPENARPYSFIQEDTQEFGDFLLDSEGSDIVIR